MNKKLTTLCEIVGISFLLGLMCYVNDDNTWKNFRNTSNTSSTATNTANTKSTTQNNIHPVINQDSPIATDIDTVVSRFNYMNSHALNSQKFNIASSDIKRNKGAEPQYSQDQIHLEKSNKPPYYGFNYSILGWHDEHDKIKYFDCNTKITSNDEIAYFYTLCIYAIIPDITQDDYNKICDELLKPNKDKFTGHLLVEYQYKDYTISIMGDGSAVSLEYINTKDYKGN